MKFLTTYLQPDEEVKYRPGLPAVIITLPSRSGSNSQ
jgi:hypothetical protein